MEKREMDIRAAIGLMLTDKKNLTKQGLPELPELKGLSGHDDITAAERDKWSALDLATRVTPETPQGPEHLPTSLYHAEKQKRLCVDIDAWLEAREEGYRNLEEFSPEVAEKIHKRGQDMGLHASQRQRA